MKVKIQCHECKGTGIRIDPNAIGRVCFLCNGTGRRLFTYTLFTRRVKLEHVEKVFPMNPSSKGHSVSYADFLKGKMPL